MSDVNFTQWVIGQAGLGAIAAMGLYLLNMVYRAWLAALKEYAETNREDKKHLLLVLQQNTEASTKLTTLIEKLSDEKP